MKKKDKKFSGTANDTFLAPKSTMNQWRITP